ncbi:hypothetical protein JTB14_014881 [Gonioctena quinquepunctata]|nr:hypothetical protein JTB14_014881 [Gonioctena quinquepunctata]
MMKILYFFTSLLLVGCFVQVSLQHLAGDCAENEHFNPCTSNCEWIPSCQNRFQTPTSDDCITLCVPRCLCNRGYIRNEDTGKCVRFNQCPP